ncbi:MAG: 2-octaprenyl-6-methoxyphenyl hydroxylase [Gammaproteobacteria bacterium]
MNSKDTACDVLIVGGGLAGTTLAHALQALPLHVTLAESHDVTRLEQPGFDARATALANSTRRILENLSLWETIAPQAQAITRIHVSERGRFGAARIEAREEGVAALGYTIENRCLGAALWRALQESDRFRVIAPARYLGMSQLTDALEARLEVDGTEHRVTARVIVAADGARSGLRESLGLGARHDDYSQTAVIFNCRPRRPLDGLALERFTPNGPIALLPLPQRRAGVVWSVPASAAERLMKLDEQFLCKRLDTELGGRLGPVERLGTRASFPLHRIRARALVGPRTVLLGSAAVNLHPVAGQGFNLAMRDIAWLAEVFADELLSSAHGGDIGSGGVLDRYVQRRRRDHLGVAGLTHGLIRLFGFAAPGAGAARGLGLLAFDVIPGAKRLFARYAMGHAGRAPRLACGQTLFD